MGVCPRPHPRAVILDHEDREQELKHDLSFRGGRSVRDITAGRLPRFVMLEDTAPPTGRDPGARLKRGAIAPGAAPPPRFLRVDRSRVSSDPGTGQSADGGWGAPGNEGPLREPGRREPGKLKSPEFRGISQAGRSTRHVRSEAVRGRPGSLPGERACGGYGPGVRKTGRAPPVVLDSRVPGTDEEVMRPARVLDCPGHLKWPEIGGITKGTGCREAPFSSGGRTDVAGRPDPREFIPGTSSRRRGPRQSPPAWLAAPGHRSTLRP